MISPAPSSASGGAMYRATAMHLGGRLRHRRPVAHGGQHLDVVELVADREDLPERHPVAARQPANGPALGDARRDELEEARVGDGDVRAAPKPFASGLEERARPAGRPDRDDLGDRVLGSTWPDRARGCARVPRKAE